MRFILFILFSLALFIGTKGALAEPVIVHPDFDFAPSISRDGRLLAFVSNRSGNRDIWLQDLEAGNVAVPRQLTNHPAADEAPALNQDGSRLLYVSQESDPRGDIYLMEVKSGERKKLTDRTYGETAPLWSPDNLSILYTRLPTPSEPQAVRLRSLETEKETTLLTGASSCTFGPADWLICSREGELVALQLAKPQEIIPLATGVELNHDPHFVMPDRLFFTRSSPEDDTRSTLWMARFESDKGLIDPYQLTPDGSTHQHPVAVNSWVYYGDIQDGEIYRIDIDSFLQFYENPLQAQTQAARYLTSGQTDLGLMILGNLSANPARIPANQRLSNDLEFLYFLQENNAFQKARALLNPYLRTPGAIGALASIHATALAIYEATPRVSLDELHTLALEGVASILKIMKQWPNEQHVFVRANLEISRLFLLAGDAVSAQKQLTAIDTMENKEWRVQALFVRGQIYRMLGDEAGLKRVSLQIIRTIGEKHRWGMRAIAQAIAVSEKGETFHLKIASLQKVIHENKELKHLRASALLRIAQIYQDNGEEEKTVATLEGIPKGDPELVEERKKSLWWEAERLIRLNANARAATALAELLQIADLTDVERKRAKTLMIQQRVQAAIEQRDLGDPKEAVKALGQIIADHPDAVEAHREYVATQGMLGKGGEILSHYQRLAEQNPQDPLRLYTYALALTYEPSLDFPAIIALLTKAVEQSPNISFFHQTLAWTHEQYKIQSKGEQGDLEQAADSYQTALRLTDRTMAPQMEANLLLNLGNLFFTMKNHSEAYRYFTRWTQRNRPLADPLANALLHRKMGESAFKTDHTQEAISFYRKALELLPESQPVLRLDVTERLALAHQTLGEHAQAVTHFAQVLEGNLALNKSDNLALLKRNMGINLYQSALPSNPVDRTALQEALTCFLNSLTLLEKYGKKERPADKGFFSLVLSLGEHGSQAALGFDRSGEEKLLFSFVAKVYEALEEPELALRFLQKKQALLSDSANTGDLTEKSILLNQIGLMQFRLGQRAAALESIFASLILTEKLNLNFGNRVNLYNLSKIAVEMFLARESVNPDRIAHLANRLEALEWGMGSQKSGFYTLANTAFLLANLPDTSIHAAGDEKKRLTEQYRLYELKSRADSLYRRAEPLLTSDNGFTNQELFTNKTRIKLNRIVIARGAGKLEAAARLTSEVEQLVLSK
ncbi:MAG: PD40 domain-containing protein [Magnetococcales bacterium]|nr:PD40 domain-containing protein [Magnetococcales bacterium]